MKVFLMLGQSNMAGRGDPREVAPLSAKHTFVLRNGKWQSMTEPINFDRPICFEGKMGTNSGIGPAASFARAFADFYGEDTGLVPCAEGGSSLDDWAPGGQLFLNACFQAKLAANVGELTGILWHQGEAECSDKEKAGSYAERFLHIMSELNKFLGTDLDIVVGELGEFFKRHPGKPQYVDTVNQALHTLAEEHDNIAIASSEGLADRGDLLHFSAEAQREFGRRYFEAYREMIEKRKTEGGSV